MLYYSNIVDGITFTGTYSLEEDEQGYLPIVTLCTLEVRGLDLMIVVDPRVVHEIEAALLADYQWNA